MFYGQTFQLNDLLVVGILVLLEGILSLDNALVLGVLVKRLPAELRPRALSYGLIGAFVFRLLAIVTAAWLMRYRSIKLLGGLYLLYVAIKHFYDQWRHRVNSAQQAGQIAEKLPAKPGKPPFWRTVAAIELTDIAFAVDSILAAMALVVGSEEHLQGGIHPKLWVVLTGGMLGVVLMRFAAALFVRLLERFPRFETSAYWLVAIIGLKLVLDWALNADPANPRIGFHSPHELGFWVLWISMLVAIAAGLRKKVAVVSPAAQATPDH